MNDDLHAKAIETLHNLMGSASSAVALEAVKVVLALPKAEPTKAKAAA